MVPEPSRRDEWARKAAHISFFAPVFLLPWIPPAMALALACVVILGNALVLPRLLPVLFPSHRGSAGGRLEAVHYPMAVAVCLLAPAARGSSSHWYLMPVAAWFALAVLDGFLGLAHARFRVGPLPWNPRKSFSGWFIGSFAASVPATLLWWKFISPGQLWLPALLCLTLGLLESVWFRVDDNFVLPFAASALLAVIPSAFAPGAATLWDSPSWMQWLLPLAFGGFALLAGKLNPGGAVMGWVCSSLLSLVHPGLFALLALFFLLGVAATSFKMGDKEKRGLAEPGHGKRGAAEVFGAAGVAAWIGAGILVTDGMHRNATYLLCAAPMLAKAMDTVSSEIGKAMNGSVVTLWPLRQAEAGTKGGISLVGTLAGIAAAGVMTIPLLRLHWAGTREAGLLIAIAIAANAGESLYSAWVARQGWDDGPHANVFLTLTAATLAAFAF